MFRTGMTQGAASCSRCCRIPWVELASTVAECEPLTQNVRVPTLTARTQTTKPTSKTWRWETDQGFESELILFAIPEDPSTKSLYRSTVLRRKS